MIDSMTGYASRQFMFKEDSYKLEMKSLNHRFLDLKLRTPRDFAPYEAMLKSTVEAKIKRGSVELWIERLNANKINTSKVQVNSNQAEYAFRTLEDLRTRLGIKEAISIRDVVSFPDVVEKVGANEWTADDLKLFEPLLKAEVDSAVNDLVKMRRLEGEKLKGALMGIIGLFKKAHGRFVEMRDTIQGRAKDKIRKRVETCFEAYGTSDEKLRALMESRIAQEVSYAIEKLDIEEELTRFRGHIDQIELLLNQGGAVGKKLDFMFQELNREVNTLGNKSQDLGVSQEVIEIKMWIEQMREQSLNLE